MVKRRQKMSEMDADERFEMYMSLIAVALITTFTVTPWVPKLILVCAIYALMSKYTWILVIGVGSIWYLRKPQPYAAVTKAAALATAKMKDDGDEEKEEKDAEDMQSAEEDDEKEQVVETEAAKKKETEIVHTE